MILYLMKFCIILVGRMEGVAPNPIMIIERLNNIVRDNEAFIVAARADRAERHMTQTIRQEQDEALQDALRQDQEKERKKKELEDQKKKAEEEENARVIQEQSRKEKIAQAKIECASLIPSEPDTSETNSDKYCSYNQSDYC